MLPPSLSEAVLRRPLRPKHGFGLPRRKHGLRTPNRLRPSLPVYVGNGFRLRFVSPLR
jgi:hypothetical protein